MFLESKKPSAEPKEEEAHALPPGIIPPPIPEAWSALGMAWVYSVGYNLLDRGT